MRAICRLMIAAGLTLSTATASAQARVRTGVIAGTSIATLTELADNVAVPSAALEAKYRAGFQGGLYAQIAISNRFSLQPEVQYVQKGAYFEGGLLEPGQGSVGDVALRLGYVDIPVLARLDLGNQSRLHPFLVVGPSLALRMQCTTSLKANNITLKSECEDAGETPQGEPLDPFRKSDINGIIGAGLATTMMGRGVAVQARMSQSLRSVGNDGIEGGSPFTPKNRAISIVFSFTQ